MFYEQLNEIRVAMHEVHLLSNADFSFCSSSYLTYERREKEKK